MILLQYLKPIRWSRARKKTASTYFPKIKKKLSATDYKLYLHIISMHSFKNTAESVFIYTSLFRLEHTKANWKD